MNLSPENSELLTQLKTLHDANKLEGMFPNIPNEVYHHPECPGVSKSNLDSVAISYDHYLQSMAEKKDEHAQDDFKDKFFIGTAYHMMTLEPELFDKTFAVPPTQPKYDRRTKSGKEAFEYWEATVYSPWIKENDGKTHLDLETFNQLSAMKDATLKNARLKKIIENSAKEVTFFWRDEKTGITCRCRPDAISMEFGIVLDLKSTGTGADFISFRKAMVNFNYDRQAAFYLDGIQKVTGRKMNFVFGVCEKKEPFGVQAFSPVEPVLEVGRLLYRKSLDRIAAVHQGKAPSGYAQEIVDIDLPAWGFDVDSRT